MLRSYWKKAIPLEELLAVNNEAEKLAWKLQADAGVRSLCITQAHISGLCCTVQRHALFATATVLLHPSGNHLAGPVKHGGTCSAHRVRRLVECRHQPGWSGWNSVRPGPGHYLLPGPCPCPVLCESRPKRPHLISLHSPLRSPFMHYNLPCLLHG